MTRHLRMRKNKMNMKEQSVKQRQTVTKKAASTSIPMVLRSDTTTGGEVIELPDGEVGFVGVEELTFLLQCFVQGVVAEVTQSNSAPPLFQPLRLQ